MGFWHSFFCRSYKRQPPDPVNSEYKGLMSPPRIDMTRMEQALMNDTLTRHLCDTGCKRSAVVCVTMPSEKEFFLCRTHLATHEEKIILDGGKILALLDSR